MKNPLHSMGFDLYAMIVPEQSQMSIHFLDEISISMNCSMNSFSKLEEGEQS